MSYRLAVIKWAESDEIAESIMAELEELGHQVFPFLFDAPLPAQVDVVLSFAPYGKLLHLFRQIAAIPPGQPRPFYVHWNTENIPDPRIPWPILYALSVIRSWVDRLSEAQSPFAQFLMRLKPFAWMLQHMFRFRYVGDYFYAYRNGWLNLLVDPSQIFANWYKQHGLPAVHVPWGTIKTYFADLQLPRKIDVVWFGQRRTQRRGALIDRIRQQLELRGYNMYIADGDIHPFVWGEARTQLLNQTKIAVNLMVSARHDNIFPYRFHVAAGNRCLVVSEPELDHCINYRAGIHYIKAAEHELVDTLNYYLQHERERQQVTENAYQLATTEMTLSHSVSNILQAVEKQMQRMPTQARPQLHTRIKI